MKHAVEAIQMNGFVFVTDLFEEKEFEAYREKLGNHSKRIMRDLSESKETIGIGSSSGFHEVCLRSEGRYDIPTWIHGYNSTNAWTEREALPKGLMKTLSGIAKEILGENLENAFSGVVISEPGSCNQYWHADSLHLKDSHEPANVLNVLVAIDPVPVLKGPTEFIPGSHVMTNHHTNESVKSSIVYQDINNTPESIGMSSCSAFTMALPVRSAVIFDDRILHRGLGNLSGENRDVAYFSLKRAGFRTDTHFEATQSLY